MFLKSIPVHTESWRRLVRIVEELEYGMLVTQDALGSLHGRPMLTSEITSTGEVWFITTADAITAREVLIEPHVNISYSDRRGEYYASISGLAEVIQDLRRVHDLWTPMLLEWFPSGPDDRRLVLIRVRPDRAEYWDRLLGRMVAVTDEERAA
jgi:general stress protein 26